MSRPGRVTCPAGYHPAGSSPARNAVIFGAACRGCPLRARCTTSQKTGRRPCTCTQHDGLAARAARADWAADPRDCVRTT